MAIQFRTSDGFSDQPVSGAAPLPVSQTNNTSYQLASNQAINNGANSAAVTGVASGSYIWAIVGTGAGWTAHLQVLGPDGSTWQDVTTLASTGGQVGVVIGANASVRVLMSGANATAVYSTLT